MRRKRSSPVDAATTRNATNGHHPSPAHSGCTEAMGPHRSLLSPEFDTCSSNPRSPRSAHPARCAPSTNASAPGVDIQSRSSRPPGRWPRCSGTCSIREQNYAYTLPTALAKKIRTIELKAGHRARRPGGPHMPVNREQRRAVERQIAEHAQAYERTITDWQRAAQTRTTPARA